MSIDKMIETLQTMKKNWGNLDIRVKKTFSTGTNAYVEPWLNVTQPAYAPDTKLIVIE
jgi:hypothetical protein